jgi:hypothetical protein
MHSGTSNQKLIPIAKLPEHGYPLCRSKAYSESKAGRLTLTKVGSRNYVAPADAEAWLASLPKVGNAGASP